MKFETTLGNMAVASEEPKFKEELSTIEHWFMLLSESEQTATVYTLLQNANPGQLHFLLAVLQQMVDASNSTLQAETAGNASWRQPSRNLRPPSLNLASPATSGTTSFSTSATNQDPINRSAETYTDEQGISQQVVVKLSDEKSWASMVSTPNDIMFKKRSDTTPNPGTPDMFNSGAFPPAGFNMSMLRSMGFSDDAQMLAIQLMMGSLMQPAGVANENTPPSPQQQRHLSQQPRSQSHAGASSNWRASSTSRSPGSALRSSKTVPKSAGWKSSGLKSATSVGSGNGITPKEDDIDPQILEDVPVWLKSLRLHKYTSCFEGMNWRDIIELDEATLEKKGVVALGARKRLTKTFDAVKKKMGMDSPASLGPASASAILATSLLSASLPTVPHSAAP